MLNNTVGFGYRITKLLENSKKKGDWCRWGCFTWLPHLWRSWRRRFQTL